MEFSKKHMGTILRGAFEKRRAEGRPAPEVKWDTHVNREAGTVGVSVARGHSGANVTGVTNDRFTPAQIRAFLAKVADTFSAKPFKVHSVFSSGHAQTLGAYAWPRRYRFQRFSHLDEGRLFEVEPGVQGVAHCRGQPKPSEKPTIILWHGIEGSTASVYMISTAHKAFRAGYNVLRVNFRNCGGTEHLTPTLYHGGLSGDLRAIINELITHDKLPRIYTLGFSLGGNVILKLGGEYGNDPPP